MNTTDDRCKHKATDPETTRTPREDGYRCGHTEGHVGNHELFTADGEHVLFAGRWEAPEDPSTTAVRRETPPEALVEDITCWDDTIARDGPCDGTWDSLADYLIALGWTKKARR